MTVLSDHEIRVGLVVTLDIATLKQDPAVIDTYPPFTPRELYYVCTAVYGDHSAWTPLTQVRGNGRRLEIEKKWKQGGYGVWIKSNTYLLDSTVLYFGPKASFVRASFRDRSDKQNRPTISEEGMAFIHGAIERNRSSRKAAHAL